MTPLSAALVVSGETGILTRPTSASHSPGVRGMASTVWRSTEEHDAPGSTGDGIMAASLPAASSPPVADARGGEQAWGGGEHVCGHGQDLPEEAAR